MIIKQNVAFKTNNFYVLAEKYRKSITSESDIEKENRTNMFYQELENMVKHGEIIIININAKMRLGKSTEAIALGQTVFDYLVKYNQNPPRKTFGMHNIARDQQEKSKLMRDPDLCNTVIVTDESNELENGGENATANQALNTVFSSVQAARYVHSICCSPKTMVDENADVLLSAIAINKETMTTRNKLYYRYYEGGNEFIQLLGFVDINVKNLILNWETNVKKVFRKTIKSEQDKKFIEEQMKKDFYVEYIVKKHEKMDLINKEGIFRPRVLDNAKVILEVCEQLSPLTVLGSTINAAVARNYIKIAMRKHKIPLSIIGEELATRDVMGMLDLYKAQKNTIKEYQAIKQAYQTGKLEKGRYEIMKENIEKMSKELTNAINIQLKELENYADINEKYNTILSE